MRQCRVEGGTTAVEVDGDEPLRAPSQWKPLLLLIPLRLGLSDINPVYINGLKVIYYSLKTFYLNYMSGTVTIVFCRHLLNYRSLSES